MLHSENAVKARRCLAIVAIAAIIIIALSILAAGCNWLAAQDPTPYQELSGQIQQAAQHPLLAAEPRARLALEGLAWIVAGIGAAFGGAASWKAKREADEKTEAEAQMAKYWHGLEAAVAWTDEMIEALPEERREELKEKLKRYQELAAVHDLIKSILDARNS